MIFIMFFFSVLSILSDDVETDSAIAGENVKVRLDSVDEEEISKVRSLSYRIC